MKDISKDFGKLVFNDRVMKANLSREVYESLKKTIDEGAQLDVNVANEVARAMKDWAVENGAPFLVKSAIHQSGSAARARVSG